MSWQCCGYIAFQWARGRLFTPALCSPDSGGKHHANPRSELFSEIPAQGSFRQLTEKSEEKLILSGSRRHQGGVTTTCNRRLRIRYQTRKEHWDRAGKSKPFQNIVHSIVPGLASSSFSLYHGHRRRVSIRKLGGWRHNLAFHSPRTKRDDLQLFFRLGGGGACL